MTQDKSKSVSDSINWPNVTISSNCDACEGTGRIQIAPESDVYHPCDTCRPDECKAFMDGYNASREETEKAVLELIKVYFDLSRNNFDDDIGKTLDVLIDTILDMLGIPKDETIEKPKGYCRDAFYFEFYSKQTPDEILECLKNGKKIKPDSIFRT